MFPAVVAILDLWSTQTYLDQQQRIISVKFAVQWLQVWIIFKCISHMVLVVMQWQPSWISNKRLSNDYLYTDLIKF
jgi:hypothetical protein